jgi:spermidine/putrescine transport system permease protein
MNIIKKIVREEFPFILAVPSLIWQFFFLYFPLLILGVYSFWNVTQNMGKYGLTLEHYRKVIDPLYFRVILRSLGLATVTSVLCVLIAYPVAYFFSFKVKHFKTVLLFSLILPSWTSFIVQIYSWFFLLQKKGFFHVFLEYIGVLNQNTHLLNNFFSILVGMVYCFLPFMILPIYAVLERMDKDLIEASADLGANQINTFRRVILPISFPGVIAGFLLVFICAFGEFAIPDLLGGSKTMFWGSVIVDKFLYFRDWQAGSALTALGILVLVSLFAFVYLVNKVFVRIVKR